MGLSYINVTSANYPALHQGTTLQSTKDEPSQLLLLYTKPQQQCAVGRRGKNLIVSIFGVSFFLLGLLSALTKLHSSSWNKPSNVAWYPWCLATRKRAKFKGKAFISQQTCCSKPAHSIHASKYCASNEHGYFGRCTLWSSLKTCAKSQTHILSSKTRGVFW